VTGFKQAKYKSFKTRDEAEDFIRMHGDVKYSCTSFVADQSKDQVTVKQREEARNFVVAAIQTKRAEQKDDLCDTSSLHKRSADGIIASAKRSSAKRAKTDPVAMDTLGSISSTVVISSNGEQARIIEVYTDGASSSNGKITAAAGWGVYWPENGDPKSDLYQLNESSRLPGELQTNNRAELMGIIRAIQLCPDPSAQLKIYTDSQYCINGACLPKRREWQEKYHPSDDCIPSQLSTNGTGIGAAENGSLPKTNQCSTRI
jgi:ribonuclease HI